MKVESKKTINIPFFSEGLELAHKELDDSKAYILFTLAKEGPVATINNHVGDNEDLAEKHFRLLERAIQNWFSV